MKISHILLVLSFVCVAVAGGMYVFAYTNAPYAHINPEHVSNVSGNSPTGKIAASPVSDGTYTVYIHSIMSTGEDTSITFNHITYFEGTVASSSARHDVTCPDHPLEACVPTLTRGFYVRESGALEFSAPLPSSSPVVLRDNPNATYKSLRTMVREFQPVFTVVIQDGNIVSITERSPL